MRYTLRRSLYSPLPYSMELKIKKDLINRSNFGQRVRYESVRYNVTVVNKKKTVTKLRCTRAGPSCS